MDVGHAYRRVVAEGVEQRLSSLELPTLVITGALDPLVSPRQARRAAELIQADLAKIGVDAEIAQVSALKPGFWELILKAKSGHRKVACTVSGARVLGRMWRRMMRGVEVPDATAAST